MGDYAPASIEFFDVEGHEQRIMRIATEYGFSTDWDNQFPYHQPELSQIVDGVRLVLTDAHLGLLGELAPELEELGISFVACQDGYCEYSGEIIMYTPKLGQFFSDCDNEGHVFIREYEIDTLVDIARGSAATPSTFSKLCIVLDKETGRAWREYFAARRKKIEDAAVN
jgi:hypothetical protein